MKRKNSVDKEYETLMLVALGKLSIIITVCKCHSIILGNIADIALIRIELKCSTL